MSELVVAHADRWVTGSDPPICPRDLSHGAMYWKNGIARRFNDGTFFYGRHLAVPHWACEVQDAPGELPCHGARWLCSRAGHGEIVVRDREAMGDRFCPECQELHFKRYVVNPTPARRLICAEAERRGGTCEFTLFDGQRRCLSRFEDGGLEWHHLNPEEKVGSIATLAKGASPAVLEMELAKCQLLCRWHHRRSL